MDRKYLESFFKKFVPVRISYRLDFFLSDSVIRQEEGFVTQKMTYLISGQVWPTIWYLNSLRFWFIFAAIINYRNISVANFCCGISRVKWRVSIGILFLRGFTWVVAHTGAFLRQCFWEILKKSWWITIINLPLLIGIAQ